MNGYKNVFKKYTKTYKSKQNKNNYSYNKNNQQNQNINNEKSLSSKNFKGKLKYVKTIEDHSEPINNMIYLENSNYLTSDNNEFYIRNFEDNNNNKKNNFGQNSKIKKIIYSSSKIVFLVVYTNQNNGQEEKGTFYKVNVSITSNNNQNQLYSCNTRDSPNDMLISDNVIVTVGKNLIEIFELNQNNNNDPLRKVSEFQFNNNEEKYSILSIQSVGKKIICAHASGHISFWEPIVEYPYLKNNEPKKIHMDAINNFICDKNTNNEDILITCSSDKTIKIHSLDELVCFQVINFNEEVIDIKKIFDYEGQSYFIVNLKNGILKIYDASFKEVLIIPNSSNTNNNKHVLNIIKSSNNYENENNEDYILISEDNKINIYKWVKNEEKKHIEQSNKGNYNKKFFRNNW